MSKKSIVTIVILIVVIAVVGIVSGYFILTNDGPYTGVVTLADTGEPVEGVSVSDGRNVKQVYDALVENGLQPVMSDYIYV